jgi:hypothetical protein
MINGIAGGNTHAKISHKFWPTSDSTRINKDFQRKTVCILKDGQTAAQRLGGGIELVVDHVPVTTNARPIIEVAFVILDYHRDGSGTTVVLLSLRSK